MEAKLKSGTKFYDVKTKQNIHVEKVDLKGVHLSELKSPIPLMHAIHSIKDKVWLPK